MRFAPFVLVAAAAWAQVPSVQIKTNFTGVVLPPYVSVVPVRYSVDFGADRVQQVPLTCTATQCTGNVEAWTNGGKGTAAVAVARGTDGNAVFPAALPIPSAVRAGGNHALWLNNGRVWAVGEGSQGQLGNGSLSAWTSNWVPVAELSGQAILQVSAGEKHSLALDSRGQVWAWGANDSGQAGQPVGTLPWQVAVAKPTLVKLASGVVLTGIVEVVASGSTSYARAKDGTVWAWGANTAGQCGVPAGTNPDAAPVAASGHASWLVKPLQVKVNATTVLNGVTSLAGGRAFAVALRSNLREIWGWGLNDSLQLGPTAGIRAPQFVLLGLKGLLPLAFPGSTVADSTGWQFPSSLLASGSHVWASLGEQNATWIGWGSNVWGALAEATSATIGYRAEVTSGYTRRALGAGHGLEIRFARDAGGNELGQRVFARGDNRLGQGGANGFGTTGGPWREVLRGTESLVAVDVAAANGFSVALLSDGSTVAWGSGFGSTGSVSDIAVLADAELKILTPTLGQILPMNLTQVTATYQTRQGNTWSPAKTQAVDLVCSPSGTREACRVPVVDAATGLAGEVWVERIAKLAAEGWDATQGNLALSATNPVTFKWTQNAPALCSLRVWPTFKPEQSIVTVPMACGLGARTFAWSGAWGANRLGDGDYGTTLVFDGGSWRDSVRSFDEFDTTRQGYFLATNPIGLARQGRGSIKIPVTGTSVATIWIHRKGDLSAKLVKSSVVIRPEDPSIEIFNINFMDGKSVVRQQDQYFVKFAVMKVGSVFQVRGVGPVIFLSGLSVDLFNSGCVTVSGNSQGLPRVRTALTISSSGRNQSEVMNDFSWVGLGPKNGLKEKREMFVSSQTEGENSISIFSRRIFPIFVK